MTTRNAAFRRLAFSAILLAIPFNCAFAQDVTAVAERIKAAARQRRESFSAGPT